VNVGDLVKIASYCINGGRLAIVTEADQFGSVRIVYVDGGQNPRRSNGEGHAALVANLRLVSESR
jgi:hypothetical protein